MLLRSESVSGKPETLAAKTAVFIPLRPKEPAAKRPQPPVCVCVSASVCLCHSNFGVDKLLQFKPERLDTLVHLVKTNSVIALSHPLLSSPLPSPPVLFPWNCP